MQFTIIAAIFAGLAIAAPLSEIRTAGACGYDGCPPSDEHEGSTETTTNKSACCSSSSSSANLGGLIGGIGNGILAGSCTLNILGENCSSDEVEADCPTSDQTGLINVGSICIPVNL